MRLILLFHSGPSEKFLNTMAPQPSLETQGQFVGATGRDGATGFSGKSLKRVRESPWTLSFAEPVPEALKSLLSDWPEKQFSGQSARITSRATLASSYTKLFSSSTWLARASDDFTWKFSEKSTPYTTSSSTLFVARFLITIRVNNNSYYSFLIVEQLLKLFAVVVSSLHGPRDSEDIADVTYRYFVASLTVETKGCFVWFVGYLNNKNKTYEQCWKWCIAYSYVKPPCAILQFTNSQASLFCSCSVFIIIYSPSEIIRWTY